MTEPFSFNLWTEPWITLEQPDGDMEAMGIAQTLLRAHEFRAIYESSPLVIVGVHRLLTAILQAIYDPQRPADLKQLWAAGQFDADKIATFGAEFGHRFDLFSADVPFMQSADLPMKPSKRPSTFITSLFNEISSGSNVTHFNHGSESPKKCCPACSAGGLISLSAFALPAGRGYSTSVAGIPPIFTIPLGRTLFHSLAASVLLPAFKPKAASLQTDFPCWDRTSVIGKTTALSEVGYLQGLTFATRRVRLHPLQEQEQNSCSRCGKSSTILVNSISYEAGEKLSDDFPFWQDPFVAYVVRKEKPVPLYMGVGKSLWRNFHTLFLKEPLSGKKERSLRPAVLEQMSELELLDESGIETFKSIGIRSDQASVDEWIEAHLEVADSLFVMPDGGLRVGKAIEFAEECNKKLYEQFNKAFNQNATGKTDSRRKRYLHSRTQMRDDFWASLADPFRHFVLRLGAAQDRDAELYRWVEEVRRHALAAFKAAAEQVGDDAISLRQRVQGEVDCRLALARLRSRYVPETDEEKAARTAKAADGVKKKKTSTRSKKA